MIWSILGATMVDQIILNAYQDHLIFTEGKCPSALFCFVSDH